MKFLERREESLSEKKSTLVTLQWFVVIGTSYLSLFSKGSFVQDVRGHVLIIALLASILILQRLPDHLLAHRYFNPALVIADTAMILVAIGLNQTTPWDLYLLFFFCIFIAGIGESLPQVVVGCLLISVIFLVFSMSHGSGSYLLDSEMLLRVPFLFGVSILYGYLAEQVKTEKTRAQRLQEIDRIKRQLVSALAHDIKNPLAVIMGYAATAAARLPERPENKEQLSALGRIQDNAARIVKLVMSFLDASKSESGKIDMARNPLSLNPLIREVAHQQSGDLARKNLKLELCLDEALPEVLGDEGQLERVLWNLIGNAVKFTPDGGQITVSSRTENGAVAVRVKDTGIGIAKEELPLLFKEFRRLKGSGAIEGTGLGLFVAKTIVEAHGGTVDAESAIGQGTTFVIHMPIAGRSEQRREAVS
jgi:signal transduction histidine kinase